MLPTNCMYARCHDLVIFVALLTAYVWIFFFQAEDGIRDVAVTGVQTCALPISIDVMDARTPPRRRTPTPTSAASLRPLVYPHIVHSHGVREDRRRIGTAGPVPTDRHVQNDEERVIEHPPPGHILRGDGLVQRIVDVPSNRLRLPFDGIDVKAVGEGARAQFIGAGHTLCTRVLGAVHRPVHPAGFLADVLHDVDLAARGPTDRVAVVAQQPEGGPQALPARDLNPCLHAAVPPRAQTLGLQSGRRVVTAAERLMASLDD